MPEIDLTKKNVVKKQAVSVELLKHRFPVVPVTLTLSPMALLVEDRFRLVMLMLTPVAVCPFPIWLPVPESRVMSSPVKFLLNENV